MRGDQSDPIDTKKCAHTDHYDHAYLTTEV